MKGLHNWVFHYNEYNNLWAAIPRDLYEEYWNNKDEKGIIRSERIETLVSLIGKIEEDPEFLESI